MHRITTLFLFALSVQLATAQATLNLHTASTIQQFPLAMVDSVTHDLSSPTALVLIHLNDGTIHIESVSAVDSITYSPGGAEGTPWIATRSVSNITGTTVVSGGFIQAEGDSPVSARGVCWALTPFPTVADDVSVDGVGTGPFEGELPDLVPGATYFARAYATNGEGVAYGNQVSFTTEVGTIACGDTLLDVRDGSQYLTLQVGGQCWMKENLKYLPAVMGPLDGSASSPRYYVHGYNGTEVDLAMDEGTFNTYGVLYNWPAAMAGAGSSSQVPSGVQGVCPAGWHLPSDDEWKVMEIELGMDPAEADDAGYRGTNEGSKFAGDFPLWTSGDLRDDPEFGASGLDARPGGTRLANGTFIQLGGAGRWWSTNDAGSDVRVRILSYVNTSMYRILIAKTIGASVRCVQD